MTSFELPAGTQLLRQYIRNLISLSALPGVWQKLNQAEISSNVATTLVSMLDAEVIYISLDSDQDPSELEIAYTRTGALPTAAVGTIRTVISDRITNSSSSQTIDLTSSIGVSNMRMYSVPIAFRNDAAIVVGSTKPNFPTALQKLLLNIAANEMAIALHRSQLESDEGRFLALIERSSDFISVAEIGGRTTYITPAGLKLVGLEDISEHSMTSLSDFVAENERGRVLNDLWPLVMETGRWTGEICFRHFLTNTVVPALIDWFRIDNPRTGRPMHLVVIGRDLTRQKKVEAELRQLNETLEQRLSQRTAELATTKNRLLSETAGHKKADAKFRETRMALFHAARLNTAGLMAGMIAHEISQPLAATKNLINVARRHINGSNGEVVEPLRAILDEATDQITRGARIIDRLRHFIRRGKTERRQENVRALLKEAVVFSMMSPDAQGVDVKCQFDPRVSLAYVDRVQIQQVLVNVIRNALEAMVNSTHRNITITTSLLGNDRLEIAVADTGSGVTISTAKHLFEPLFSTKTTGMGLGLSISKSIIEAHGGWLRVEPNVGGGTVVRFTVKSRPTEHGNEAI